MKFVADESLDSNLKCAIVFFFSKQNNQNYHNLLWPK